MKSLASRILESAFFRLPDKSSLESSSLVSSPKLEPFSMMPNTSQIYDKLTYLEKTLRDTNTQDKIAALKLLRADMELDISNYRGGMYLYLISNMYH